MEIKILGIKRNASLIHDQDGACTDIINMRYKDEEWQSFQPPQEKWLLRNTIQNANSAGIWFNHKATVDSKLIWWDNTNLYEVDATTDTKTLIRAISSVTKIYEYGKILVVITVDDVYYFRYKDAVYTELKQIEHGRYFFDDTDREYLTGGFAPKSATDWVNEGLAKMTEVKRHNETAGKINGHVYFRVAFRTTDGNYILHSPIYYRFIGYDGNVPTLRQTDDGSVLTHDYYMGFWAKPRFNFSFTLDQLDIINSYSGMVDKLCVFMTKPQYDWDYLSDKDSLINFVYYDGGTTYTDYYLPHTDQPDKFLEDNNSFYLVSELSLDDIISGPKTIEVGDVANLLTKTDLPVDDFTSHRYFSDVVYEYNSRLHYGDLKTRLADSFNLTVYDTNDAQRLPHGFTPVQDKSDQVLGFDLYALVKLNTENGVKTILTKYDYIAEFTDGTDKYACLNPIFMYPDQRAISFRIIAFAGTYTTISDEYTLKAHPLGNYAYYQFPFTEYVLGSPAGIPSGVSVRSLEYFMLKLVPGVSITPKEDRIIEDTNRIQVSQLNNLLYFPAKYSYRIGRLTNKIVGIASQAMPVSTGQFGQYPVYVFTTEGIFVLEQGTSVLYQSIKPVSLHVCTNPESITKIEGGILFSTDYGLFIISGSQVTEISKVIEGEPESFLNSLTQYQDLLNYFPDAGDNVSTTPFKAFLSDSIIGYDHANKEIIITGNTYDGYSYVYSLLYNVWYKRSYNFSHLFADGFNLRYNRFVHLQFIKPR